MFTFFEAYFIKLFHQYQNKKLYLSKESYAGNRIQLISNKLAKVYLSYINFQGVDIENGWTDLPLQYSKYTEYAIAKKEYVNYINFSQESTID